MNFVNRQISASVSDGVVPSDFVQAPIRGRRWPIRYGSIESFAMCIDIAAILLASILAAFLYKICNGAIAIDLGKAVGSAIVASALFASNMRGKYGPAELLVLRNQIRNVCLAWTFAIFVIFGSISALNIHHEVAYGACMIFASLGLAILVADRIAIKALLVKGISGKKFAGGNIVLITDQPQPREAGLKQMLTTLGFRVTGHFRLPPPRSGCDSRKSLSTRVIRHIRGSDTEEIIVEAAPERWPELRAFVADLRVLPCSIVFVPVGAAASMFRRPTRDLGSAVCVELQRGPLTLLERTTKRLIDVVGAAVALTILSPLLAVAALAIKLDSPGPILFKQQRCGFNGRSFAIYKFRTMSVLEDGPSILQARQIDNRITRIGKWLRRTSIDELPQLLNVLDGSMSLVGPRPHAIAHDGQFDKAVHNYAFRRRVKPGLTGWAQIHGCRGPTPTAAVVERRVEYDLWYIDNWSLKLDLAILLQTPLEVLRGRNAY